MKPILRILSMSLSVILLVCLVFTITPTKHVNANLNYQLTNTCQPLDLVFLIDQSNSMGTNDRNNQRIDAVRNLIQRLYEHAGLRCLGIVHRVAVINFGSTAEVSVGLSNVGFESTTNLSERIIQESANLSREISAPNDLEQTRLLAPFELAVELLAQAPSVESDHFFNTRTRAIILVSDGNPCNPLIGLQQSCQDPSWIEHYFQPTSRTINALQSSNPSLGNVTTNYERYGFDVQDGLENELVRIIPQPTTVHVLVFNNSPNEIRPETNEAWRNITGRFNGIYISPDQVLNTTQITSLLSNLMDQLLRVENTPITCGEEFYVEPYAGSALILSAVRLDQAQISLVDPDGQEVPRGNGVYDNTRVDYIVLPTIERYLINNPKPGVWRISGSSDVCENITATFETIEATTHVITQPIDVTVERQFPYIVEAENGYIEFQLNDRLGQPFAALLDYPLTVRGRVTGALDVREQLDSVPDLSFEELSSQGRIGIWRSRTPVPAPKQGSYSVIVNISVPSINPTSLDTPIEIAEFMVRYNTAPPEDVELSIIEPQNGEVRPLNTLDGDVQRNQPFQVSAQFVKADGVSVTANRLFDIPGLSGQAVEAVLLFGTREIETITLEQDTQDPTRLIGEFRSMATEEERDPEGEYRFEVRVRNDALSSYNTDNFTITSPLPTSTFQRRQIRGIKLEPRTPDTENREFPINQIIDGNSLSHSIPVSVALVDQSNQPISPAEVFPEGTDNVVFATLKAPDNSMLEMIALSNEGGNIFGGTLRSNQEALDPPGNYVIDFQIGRTSEEPVIDSSNFTYLSRIVSVGIQRYEIFGVNLRNVSNMDGTGVVPINTLETDGSRTPQPVIARAQLVNSEGVPYVDPGMIFMQPEGLLEALIIDGQGQVRDQETMSLGPDGVYVANLRVNNGDEFDPPGLYTIRIEMIDDFGLTSNRYQVVDIDSKEESLLLREFIGLRLAPQSPIMGTTLPLNTVDATGVAPVGIDVAVDLQDQDSTSLNAPEALQLNNIDGPVIRATLQQQGIDLRSVNLQLAQGSRSLFTGTIPSGSSLDTEGEFSVVFSVVESFHNIDCAETNVCYRWLNTTSVPVSFRRVEQFGLQVERANFPDRIPLNNVSQDGVEPVGFEVRARITGIGGRPLPPVENFLMNLDEAVTATLHTSSGMEVGEPITLEFDELTNEFVGRLRDDIPEIDEPGPYEVVFRLNRSTVQQSEIIVLIVDESIPYIITRYENVGIQLDVVAPFPNTTQPLNYVRSGQAVPAPVEVVVRLIDQNENPLNISNVFTGESIASEDTVEAGPTVSIELVLLGPNGLRIEGPVNLLPSDMEPDRFTGFLRTEQDMLDETGMYTLQGQLASGFTLQQTDLRRYTILNPAIPEITFRREEFIGFVMIPEEIDPPVVNLNTIDVAHNERVPKPIEVALRLRSVNDGTFIDRPSDFLISPDHSITAVMVGPQDIEIRETMRLEDGGVFRASLGSTEQIEPSGIYQIWFEFNDDAIDPTQPYEIDSDRTEQIQIQRQAIIGVRLVPVSGEVNNSEVVIAAYSNLVDAYLGNADVIELVLELQDIDGERLNINQILIEGASVQDAFQVSITQLNAAIERTTESLPITVEDDGLLRILIPDSDDGEYAADLELYLDGNQFRNEYVNLSAAENTAAIRLRREWTGMPVMLFRVLSTLFGVLLVGFLGNLIRINTPLGPGRRWVYPVKYEYSQHVKSPYRGKIKPRGFRLLQVKKIATEKIKLFKSEDAEIQKLKIVIRPDTIDADTAKIKYRVDATLGGKTLVTNQLLSGNKPISRHGLTLELEVPEDPRSRNRS